MTKPEKRPRTSRPMIRLLARWWPRCGACSYSVARKRHDSWREAWCSCVRWRWHRGPCRIDNRPQPRERARE